MKNLMYFLFLGGGLWGWKAAGYFMAALLCFAFYSKTNPGYGMIEHNAFFLVPVILLVMAGISLGVSWQWEYGQSKQK